MSQIVVPQCTKNMSGMPNFAIWLLVLYIIYQSILDIVDISRLRRMQDFYLYLLEIPESDMQTISWQEIVARLMNLRDSNPILADKVSPALRHFMGTQSKQRLDAHDIANRLMRKENYLIALFNKEILDLTLPIPLFRNRQLFSRTIQWNLNFCILDFIFTPEGQINQLVLKDSKRRQLSDALRSRFLFAGLMNILCAPVIVLYTLIVYFFQYFNVSIAVKSSNCIYSPFYRSTTKTRQRLGLGSTPRLRSGSSGSSMNCLTYSTIVSICHTHSLRDMWNSSRRS